MSETKTNGLKKGLRKQQLLLSAKKKEYVLKHLTVPDDLINFLQAEGTLEEVLKGGDSADRGCSRSGEVSSLRQLGGCRLQ